MANESQEQQQQQQQEGQGNAGQNPAGQQSPDALAAAIAQLTSALKPKAEEQQQASVSTDIQGTGDDVLDAMVQSVALAHPKLSIDRAVGEAVAYGDARFIDEAYIREVAGKDADRLIRIAKAAVFRVQETATQLKDAVFNTVGGEDNWNTAVSAFNSAAPKELRSAVATMLESGKANQVKAAAQLVSQYAASGGFIRSGAKGGATAFGAAAGSQGLSKADFQTELGKLDRNARDFREKREELFNRRTIGQKAGL